MEDEVSISGFIKIGQKEHIQALQSKGLLHLNTLRYYKKLESENKNLRHDRLEGSSNNLLPSSFEFIIGDKIIPFKSVKINHYVETNLNNHIYCLYTILSEYLDKGEFVNKDIQQFGSYALIITDIQKFINRLTAQLSAQKYKWESNLVQYYDRNQNHLKLTAFHKSKDFEYQNEFRLVVFGETSEFLQIEIGSIEDISKMISSTDLTKLNIKTEPNNDRPRQN